METVVRRQKSLRVNLDRNIISRSKMVRLTYRTNQTQPVLWLFLYLPLVLVDAGDNELEQVFL